MNIARDRLLRMGGRNVALIRLLWRLAVVAVTLTGIVGGTTCATVSAASTPQGLTLSAVVGYAGYFGVNHWVPVDILIHNAGPAQPAVLQLDLDSSIGANRAELGRLRWHITLPNRGWKHIFIAVPGNVLAAAFPPTVDCVVGGDVAGRAYLSGNALSNDLVAVLSNEAQDAAFLTGSTGPNPVLPVAIKPASIPTNPNLLANLSAVVASPTTLQQLSDNQYRALMTWVRLGGLLIVTDTVNQSPGLPMPLLPGPTRTVNGILLQRFIDSAATPQGPIVIHVRGLRPGATLIAGTSSVPLIASLSIGRGHVVQTAFSPTQGALLAWPNNVTLWSDILRLGNEGGRSALVNLLDPEGVLGLTSASDTLAPLRVPSLKIWASVFALYTLLAGPVLFAFLRRYKAESWAWGILPVLSLITTVGIYSFGGAGRPSGALAEGVGVIDFVGDGQAETYGVTGFMSPTVTSVNATTRQPLFMMPLADQSVRRVGTANSDMTALTASTSFQGVGRWSLRYIYAAGAVNNQGELDAHLAGTFGLIGTVQNNTPYDLHNVALCWEGRMFTLGDMHPGDLAAVNIETAAQDIGNNWLVAYSGYNRDITRGLGRPLSAFAANMFNLDLGANEAMVIATTSNRIPSLPQLNLPERLASNQSLSLVRQFVSVEETPIE